MSFSSEIRERTKPAVPLAAMVDVMFLLLIFFMTASVYREKERQIDVSLPATETDTSTQGKAPIIITIAADGSIYIGEGQYTLSRLYDTLKDLAGQIENESVVIRGDRGSELGLTVQVLDLCRAAGITDVALATTKPASGL